MIGKDSSQLEVFPVLDFWSTKELLYNTTVSFAIMLAVQLSFGLNTEVFTVC